MRIRPLLLGVADDDANALSFLMNHLPDDLFNRMESANPANYNAFFTDLNKLWLKRRPSSFNYGSANNMNGMVSQVPQQIVQQPAFQPPQQIVQQPVFQPPQQIVQQPMLQPPQQIKAKYYEELKNYADMGLEIEDNRVFELMEIDYAIINLANKLDQPEGLSNSPSPSINVVRTPRVNTRPFQHQFDNSCDTEETPNESAISDQEDDGEFDDNALSEESNVNRRIREIIQSELENSTLLEGIICRIIQNSNPADNIPQGETEDEEIIENMEVGFVRDKGEIDVPTVRGKINCLVLSAITVDPGSNTLIITKDIADRLGLKIDKNVKHKLGGIATVPIESVGMVYNVPLMLAPGCIFYIDFVVVNHSKSMVILSNPFLYCHKYQILGDKDQLRINCNGRDFYIPVTMHKVKNKLEVHHVIAIPSISEETDTELAELVPLKKNA
ncbi:979_t:CDS:2 [Entrophospora sp. SA101]|nr:979_t:CDS:2 [Entrophospora sp. SA101]